jgi:hypothetical protein
MAAVGLLLLAAVGVLVLAAVGVLVLLSAVVRLAVGGVGLWSSPLHLSAPPGTRSSHS